MCNVFALHPWLAGTLSVASHMLANRIGSIMSQGFKYTLGAAHLYWAIQHMGLAGSNHGAEGDDGTSNLASWTWPLMDELLALTHDGEGVFFGGPPRSLSDACKEYMILLGCNASDVTCSYRDWYMAQTKGVAKKMNQSRHDGRLKFSSKRTSPFVHPDKFAGGLWRTRVFLQPLVERVTRSRDAVQSTEAWEAAVRDTAAWGKARTFDTAEIKSDSAANSGTLFKSLSYLRAQLAAEFPSLSVNVLLLHVQSYRILSHVRSRLAGHIGLKGKSLNYSQEDAGVATWAAAPLHMLAADQDPFFRHQASPSKVKTERDLAMTLLNEIKDLIQGMTDEYSEVLSNEFDSGTFPA
ncbi:hypothetical protein BCR44DRAFT_195372 [Catenaria anguillulae PL171]|uniref:Uncharacterized protein n=1 Tax=Catenaria anguillulae PL171 TaxID=765915 RepID=A0A1Y2HP56_9FUNG|nr:hypothetical protein BCR44DRAFT_195372 [Catenaria anguillulae PL171]